MAFGQSANHTERHRTGAHDVNGGKPADAVIATRPQTVTMQGPCAHYTASALCEAASIWRTSG